MWKFNQNLLKDQAYLELIDESIRDEVAKYAAPVYNFESLKDIPEADLQLTISDNLFLEMLLLPIRGETVRYSSTKKKLDSKHESELMSAIERLEKEEHN